MIVQLVDYHCWDLRSQLVSLTLTRAPENANVFLLSSSNFVFSNSFLF